MIAFKSVISFIFYLEIFPLCSLVPNDSYSWFVPKEPQRESHVEKALFSSTFSVISNKTLSASDIQCEENYVYDDDLFKCRLKCTDEQIFFSARDICVPKESAMVHAERLALGLFKRAICKLINIHPSEYNIDENGTLFMQEINASFPRGHYTVSNSSLEANLCFPFTANFLQCQRWVLEKEEFELRQHGLVLWSISRLKRYQPGEFYLKNINEAVTCASEKETHKTGFLSKLRCSACILSATTMFITFIVYFLSPKFRRAFSKALLCHMISLFLFYVILISRWWTPPLSFGVCLAYGILLHYMFLATFFWLNVFAFIIWKGVTNHSRYVFFSFSLYAWGCPLIMSISAILTDYHSTSPFKPKFALNCWFGTMEGKILFLYGPITLLLAANVVFFILTIIKIKSLTKDAEINSKHTHVQLTKMSLKLLVMMGLFWVTEVISTFHEGYFWDVMDIVNGLSGFFLVLIYVCKPRSDITIISIYKKNSPSDNIVIYNYE